MGVKTLITLDEINKIFLSYDFISLTPTTSGIIDTTYIISTHHKSYILKKYERDISKKIQKDKQLLNELKLSGLNVPTCIDENKTWFLYEKLKGSTPTNIEIFHIQEVARFLAKLHKYSYKKSCDADFIKSYEIPKLLKYTKSNFFSYYKKLQFLNTYRAKNDGLIHGDLFKDNTVFDNKKIGVFDFIDSACGNFTFECAVALVGFDTLKRKNYFTNIFIKSYNQYAPKKIEKKELLKQIDMACGFYALLRIQTNKSTSQAKELIYFC
ncbi:MAG: phosphotransferase [Sulfurimonas sp.]|nr:phosphotransferase [Sulfurimonas sp.]